MGKSKSGGSFDTNMRLRLVLGDVPSQTHAVEGILAAGVAFDVSNAALIEMVYVLEKILRKDRMLIQENVSAITRDKRFLTSKKLFAECMPLYVEHPSLSMVDCVLLTEARLRKAIPLYTFDQKLVQHSNEDAIVPR